MLGRSLMAWWLGLPIFTAMTQVQSLRRQLRSCQPWGMATSNSKTRLKKNFFLLICSWVTTQDFFHQFISVQSLSHVRLYVTPWIEACQAFLSITNSQISHKLMCITWVMPFSHLILCRPLLLLPQSLPASESFPMGQLFATLHMRWPKYWSFSFSVSPSKEIPGLISFRMDWLDLLACRYIIHKILIIHCYILIFLKEPLRFALWAN